MQALFQPKIAFWNQCVPAEAAPEHQADDADGRAQRGEIQPMKLRTTGVINRHHQPVEIHKLDDQTIAGHQSDDRQAPLSRSAEQHKKRNQETATLAFAKTPPPEWLLAFWKEIDDKTFGQGFDCFVEDATCRLGVAEWNGREKIRENLRAFIDTGFTALHEVTEYWDGGSLKVFRGIVTMKPDDGSKPTVKPVMTHFFYMDEADPSKVRSWIGSVGPAAF